MLKGYNLAMKKSGLHPLLKGLPYWLYLVFVLSLAGIIFLIFHLSSASITGNPSAAAGAMTPAAGGNFSPDEASIKSKIETFEVSAHTINVYRSAEKRASLYTGTYLQEWDDYFYSLDGTNNWTIVSQSTVSKVKIVSSSTEKIIALACVNDSELSVDPAGKLLKQLPAESFAGAYVFVNTAGTWKIGSFINVSEASSARKIYQAMPSDLQELSGPLSDLLKITCK
jgi:hypothetical protein